MAKKLTLGIFSLIAPIISLCLNSCSDEEIDCSNLEENRQTTASQDTASQECQTINNFDAICMNDLLDASKHSEIYTSMLQQCIEEGRLEDEFYASQDTTAFEEARNSFMRNNPLIVLGDRIEFSYGNNGGIALDISSGSGGIIYTEFNDGSEFNDSDIIASAKFIRFFGVSYSRAQVDSIEIKVSRLTSRGICNSEGIMSDIARRAAFALDNTDDVFIRGYYRPNMYFSVSMQQNEGHILYTNDRIFWVSNDLLIELYDYMDPEHPQPYDFTTWELVNTMLNHFPSTVYSSETAESIKDVFYEHQYDLVDNDCIPATR